MLATFCHLDTPLFKSNRIFFAMSKGDIYTEYINLQFASGIARCFRISSQIS